MERLTNEITIRVSDNTLRVLRNAERTLDIPIAKLAGTYLGDWATKRLVYTQEALEEVEIGG